VAGPLAILIVGGIVKAAAPAIIGSAVQVEATRSRFPGIKPGDFLKAALDIQALSESGKTPRITTDPFTGDFVISTEDQSGVLTQILADREINRQIVALGEEVGGEVELQRAALQQQVRAVVPGTIGATARMVASGTVVRGELRPGLPGRPLSGPCAGGQSKLEQIRCNVGGFA